ncbi:oxysterol-binding protein 1 isoform X1 [Acipenser oxyrinchus oxyrinchus]|uniref:Oxysterol-binding protein 1 isoform X1 n=1 Tax=Acipenser oxyrinchus oxyrinchus TaxID=40147 RepID=A0AAD8FMY5_ACIOX|nr:oxysterol-binding protein 1 isoform X1 [Acipenser oxyrinchus oxyrinchus]
MELANGVILKAGAVFGSVLLTRDGPVSAPGQKVDSLSTEPFEELTRAEAEPDMSEPKTASPTPGDMYKGWLFKWTNYIKGYQRRWFVLSNGLLSYYRTQAEMGHTCRGTINLATANITVEDSCNFVISNGGAQTYHLKASSEVERQRWITALELAKAKAVRMQAESDDSSDEAPVSSQGDKSEFHSILRTLTCKVEDLSTCHDLIGKHGAALQRSLSELESLKLPPESGDKIRQVNERATLFRITSNAMINVRHRSARLRRSRTCFLVVTEF